MMSDTKKLVKDTLGSLYYALYKKYKIKGNRALIYHAFGLNLSHDTYGISINMNDFKKHILFIKNNYKICHINKCFTDELSVSITIDDGYKDSLDAVDYLNELKIPFSLYISTDFIGKKNYLNERDIYNISSIDTCILGSHGSSHKRLGELTREQQITELSDSKKELEKITQSKILSLSYPHGSFNNDTVNIARDLGYEWASTSIKGFNTKHTHKYKYKRIEIIASDTIDCLTKKIDGYYDYY